jgi:hypothetical protein
LSQGFISFHIFENFIYSFISLFFVIFFVEDAELFVLESYASQAIGTGLHKIGIINMTTGRGV